MYSLIRLLQQIGLSEKESQIYVVCLKIGTNPASTIAKHAEFNRCTTYTILESLLKKGLVIQFEKNSIKYFTAVEPRCLLTYIEDKKRILSYYKSAIDDKIPDFESLKNPFSMIPNFKTYAGKEGIRKIYEEVMNETKLWILATKSKKNNELFTKYIPQYLNKHPSVNVIITPSNQKIHVTSTNESSELSFIEPLQLIGRDRVFIVSTNENYGIEIANSDIVNQFTSQFEKNWKIKN